MFIQTEATPNPETMKFLPGQQLLESGTYECTTEEAAANSPFAQRLFKLQGVRSIFISGDFVSITKEEDTDWSMLKPMVLAAIMEHLSVGMPIFHGSGASSESVSQVNEDDDEITLQIKELLDTRVRPMVAMDGGDIVFDSFDADSGVVYLRMQGACAGCPSSTATLKMGIENMLRHFLPEVQEVRPVDYF